MALPLLRRPGRSGPDGAGTPTPDAVPAVELAARLRAALGVDGPGVVDDSTRRRAEYSSDASNYRVVPAAVLYPRSTDDVEAAQQVCRELSVPMTSRGGGTSVAGNAIGPGLVLDFSRHLRRIVEIDPDARTAVVEPGVVLDDLQQAAAVHGLRFGPDPSTHARCTLGGMIANDACGSHALAYGRTSDNVVGLDVLDGGGRRFDTASPPAALTSALRGVAAQHLATIRTEFGTFGRQVSGYALEHLLPEHNPGGRLLDGTRLARLLTGSEGTLTTTLAATVRLVRPPASTAFVVLGFPDMAAAADATPALLVHSPLAMEGIDRRLVEVVRARGRTISGLPAGEGWLFVEMGGADAAESKAAATALIGTARRAGATEAVLITDAGQARALWRIREDGAGLAGRSPDGRPAWPGWEDAAVPPAQLGSYWRDFEKLLTAHDLDALAYGHFGDGCIHARIDFPLDRPGGSGLTRQFLVEAAQLVASYGGSLSGEHGDGRARGELLPILYSSPAITAFGQVKAAFDPADLLNPGVLVRPSPLDTDLRLPAARKAVDLAPPGRRRQPAFDYPQDDGDLTRAVHRCVGVGKCRADSGGVMCPSFLATGDEKDSTRGRARVLQEMANGTLVTDSWQSTEVLESLDLCLSCKGCAVDCPAGVDMATYKADFLDHHYRGRRRPPSHYALGWLPRWARLARRAPTVVNALVALPGVASALRAAGGIDQRRPLPRFASPGFRRWFARKPLRTRAGSTADRTSVTPVILWVDTFTENFDPAVGRAAVAVLEELGFAVHLTARQVCCGLTWVSTGQLDGARRQLRAGLDALERTTREIGDDAGAVPIVGLEPSCTALLREDAARLLPDDPRARALAQRVVTLAELLTRHRPDWRPPAAATARPAVVQEHCHQHAGMGFGPDRTVLAGAGIEATVLSGCCGLAGNFGAEKGHYDVSVAIAEHALLPAVRAATAEDPAALLVADGFSCRTQLDNLTGRRPLHLAEVLAQAIGVDPQG